MEMKWKLCELYVWQSRAYTSTSGKCEVKNISFKSLLRKCMCSSWIAGVYGNGKSWIANGFRM